MNIGEIEKEIPHPDGLKENLKKMEIDDSVLISECNVQSVRSIVHTFGKKHEDLKFKTRKISDDAVRIWRVA